MSTLRDFQNAGSIVTPYLDDASTLAAMANVIRQQSGYEDMTGPVKEYEAATKQSDQRMQGAFDQSQQDPRNWVDKVAPGVLGLGAVIDLIRKKKHTPEKFQYYRNLMQQGVEKKKMSARQKYLDILAQEEMLGKRRGQVLEAKSGAISDKNATIRTSTSTAAGVQDNAEQRRRFAAQQKQQDFSNKLAERREDRADTEFNLSRKQLEVSEEILSRDPSTWSQSDRAHLSLTHPAAQIKTAEELATETFGQLREEAMKSFNATVDTEGMGPEEVANAFSVFLAKYVQSAILTLPGDDKAQDPWTTNLKPGQAKPTRIGTPGMYPTGAAGAQSLDPSVLEMIGKYTGANTLIDWGKRTSSRYADGR